MKTFSLLIKSQWSKKFLDSSRFRIMKFTPCGVLKCFYRKLNNIKILFKSLEIPTEKNSIKIIGEKVPLLSFHLVINFNIN
jgi:hypothetical protein